MLPWRKPTLFVDYSVHRLKSFFKNFDQIKLSICSLSTNSTSEFSEDFTPVQPNLLLKKVIKVAFIGMPNAGKSTLINALVGKTFCPVSPKIHTTRHKSSVTLIRGNTQLVFLDTPGIVSKVQTKKFHLEESFINDVISVLKEADVVGVLHDCVLYDNKRNLHKVLVRVLRTAALDKPLFLILNKVDCVKNPVQVIQIMNEICGSETTDKTEQDKSRRLQFSPVFRISALKGTGVNLLLDYLLKTAKPGEWIMPEDVECDTPTHELLAELIRARYLSIMPKEMPYLLKFETELIRKNEFGEIEVYLNVICPSERLVEHAIGRKGKTVQFVADSVMSEVKKTLETNMNLKLNVVFRSPDTNEPQFDLKFVKGVRHVSKEKISLDE